MAKRLSLAEKYAQSKQSTTTKSPESSIKHYTLLRSPYRRRSPKKFTYSPKLQNLTSQIPELKPHIPESNNIQINGNWKARSPIRPIKKPILLTPNRIKRTSSLYKVLPYESNNLNLGTNGIRKDRSWRSKKDSSQGLVREGVFQKLKNFLSKFSLEEQERKNLEFEALRESAKNVLSFPVNERSQMENESPLRSRRRFQDDDDEVDAMVQKAKLQLEKNKRSEEKQELLQIIEKEKLERKNLQEDYERRIYLMEQTHKARIQELSQEIENLTYKASSHYQEIEAQRLKELESSVMKENESFLLQQKENEERLQLIRARFERKEEELKAKEERLEEMKKEIENSRREMNNVPATKQSSIAPITVHRTSSFSVLEEEGANGTQVNDLATDVETINRASKINEIQVINFYDMMQKISERIIQKETDFSPNERRLLESLEEIVNSLDEHMSISPTDQDEYTTKLDEYSSFFDKFNPLLKENPQQARQTYNRTTLKGIEESFERLSKSLKRKLTKRAFQLRDLESQYDKTRISEYDYNQPKIDQAVQVLKRKTILIAQQKKTISLLDRLGLLTSTIHKIRSSLAESM
ncbi:hypothetical protein A9F13_10g00253 [Clavispora lusitaniae]|uniref:Uncharacterized protein n=1 Tax=Clavispora lusitaniae TaxID=36911 RepID=A0AA91PYZ7_CLALS|nr:hypothetical protein A9F13_10g00253 [Clavispora lusitaniae]